MIDQLKENDYDMAIVDLMYNECGLALAHHLNLPAVGYWAFSFASGPQEFTAQEALPSFVPAMMSYVGTKMTFLERVWNMLAKLVSRTFMYYHASIIGKNFKYACNQAISLHWASLNRSSIACFTCIMIV